MQTCVYMSNRKIQVAVGNPKNHSIAVKRLYETEAPEGSIINGVITGEEELGAHLSQFWKENHLSTRNVCLVLHSSQFMAKTLMIPAMNTNKTLNYIQREFPGVFMVISGFLGIRGRECGRFLPPVWKEIFWTPTGSCLLLWESR